MADTTQDKLYETFVAISGSQASGVDPMIDASEELANSVSDIAKVIGSTAWQGAVAASPEPAGQPAPDSGITMAGASADVAVATPPAPAVSPEQQSDSSTSDSESLTSSLLKTVFETVPLVSAAIPSTQSGSSAGSSGSSGGIGSTLESVASTVLKSGLGLVPLIGDLLGLFGGGDSTPAPTLEKYAMPGSIAFEGADTGSGVSSVDYDQMGMPRSYGSTGNGTALSGDAGASSGAGSAAASGGSTASAPAPQITVNVQAMDARSFMDRSSDIAAAVRDAMLNSNSINDVVNEL